MFGKGGGALSMWLKEFVALVFTQTIQAFIYAIIISIILFGMGKGGGNVSNGDNNAALGLMATFALLSVFKVEELAKKIFGIGNTKATPGNAMKSIAKTAIAAKLGSRVLNNAGKVFGGIKAINKSRQDNRKTRQRLEEDMKDNGFELDENGKAVYVGKPKGGNSPMPVPGGAGNGAGAGNPIVPGAGAGNGGNEDVNVDVDPTGDTNSSGSNNRTTVNPEISAAAHRRMRNALRNYEDKMDEIRKSRNEGIKNICAGLTESGGAIIGATAGGILGGADGNLDEALQGILAGAGVGDAVGETAVNAIDTSIKFVQRNYKRKAGESNKRFKEELESYKKALESVATNYNTPDVDDI